MVLQLFTKIFIKILHEFKSNIKNFTLKKLLLVNFIEAQVLGVATSLAYFLIYVWR